jgi:hypothetical protein
MKNCHNSFITLAIGVDVLKLFAIVIYHHFVVIPSFCVIKQHYLGNYCRMAVNYHGKNLYNMASLDTQNYTIECYP